MRFGSVGAGAVVWSFGALISSAQSDKLCEGELGELPWSCDPVTPVNPEVYSAAWLPLPSAAAGNPTMYQQIAGEHAYDEVTGERNGNAAVFAIFDGTAYQCMLAESNGEAAIFDAPEGAFVSGTEQYPTGSWLPESIKTLMAEGTKLKYLVYSHGHWDHIGAMGFVAEYFADDEPQAISSRRVRRALKHREDKEPASTFGNSRGVPLPEWYEEDVLEVGGLRFELGKAHIHMSGDYLIFLDKNDETNSKLGIDASILMVVDGIFPGWSPFFSLAIAADPMEYYEGLDEVNGYDFDVLVAGHLTRLGTKQDVQDLVDYMHDILKGAELGVATVMQSDVIAGAGIADPTSPNVGNLMYFFNEYLDRIVDVCYDYVLDASARSHDWLAMLSGVEPTLRTHCWTVQNFVRVG